MKARRIALGLAAGAALMAAAPVFAHEYGWRARHYHPHYYPAPAYVYYPARPVVVLPPPYYYYPPAAPVIYGQVPISPGVRVNFRVRL